MFELSPDLASISDERLRRTDHDQACMFASVVRRSKRELSIETSNRIPMSAQDIITSIHRATMIGLVGDFGPLRT